MPSSYSPLFNNVFPIDTKRNAGLAREFFRLARRQQKSRKLMVALLGAAVGGAANLTISRVLHSRTELGGKRPVTAVVDLNRVTTAGDLTVMQNYMQKVSKIATPVNKGWPNRRTYA